MVLDVFPNDTCAGLISASKQVSTIVMMADRLVFLIVVVEHVASPPSQWLQVWCPNQSFLCLGGNFFGAPFRDMTETSVKAGTSLVSAEWNDSLTVSAYNL